MTTRLHKSNPLSISFMVLGVFLGIMVCGALLTTARAPSSSIRIVNNSSHEIRRIFLSPPDQNNWGPDQLSNSVIAANGGSVTLPPVDCAGSSIKIIAEDEQGCFFYQVVTCSDTVTWTIASDATPDCGN